MLLFRKENSKDYLTISGSAMILHEFPNNDYVTEEISIVFKDEGKGLNMSFSKTYGEWKSEHNGIELKDYIMDFINDEVIVEKYKMGVRYE